MSASFVSRVFVAPSRLVWALMAGLAFGAMADASLAQEARYRLQPGDKLQLDVLEDAGLNRQLLVLPDGTISVPSAGVIAAGGRSLAEVQTAITTALSPNFAKPPTVYLSVGQLNERATSGAGAAAVAGTSVYAMGEVAKPGRIQVLRGTTLLQFLAESGGLTPFAATKRIQLRRTVSGVERVTLFNYDDILAGKSVANPVLQKGDVIIVPQRRLFE